MTDPAIKAALGVAADALQTAIQEWHGAAPCDPEAAEYAARTVAAFLRSCQRAERWPGFASLDDLAAAVERAAREAPHG